MAALFILAACVLLTHQKLVQNNNAPCLPSNWNNGYSIFVRRHIRSDTPKSKDHNEWSRYIRTNGDCNRPTQSFLQPKDLDRVKDVCTRKGGVIHKENLCISRQPFTFVTARINTQTCSIRSVLDETKHLILACDKLNNQCLPVHFEGNPNNSKPDNNAGPCQAPSTEVTATTTTTTTTSRSRMKSKPRGSGGRPPKALLELCRARSLLCRMSPPLFRYLLSCHTARSVCPASKRCRCPFQKRLYF